MKIFLIFLFFTLIYPVTIFAEESESNLDTPQLKVDIDCAKGQQTFSWNQIEGATLYRLKNLSPSKSVKTTTNNSITLEFDFDKDASFALDAITKSGDKTVAESNLSNKVNVSKNECQKAQRNEDESEEYRKEESQDDESKQETSKTEVEEFENAENKLQKSIESTPSQELEEKVAQLEEELVKAKQRQSALEQMVANLLSSLKKFIPFWD